MAPIILCLLSFAALGLWVVYSTMCGIRAIISATYETLVYALGVWLMYLIICLCADVVIIVFADISVLWDIIADFFRSLGGFWGVLAYMLGIGLIVGFCAILGPIFVFIGNIVVTVAGCILGLVMLAFEFVEGKSKQGYGAVVTKIAKRLTDSQGGRQ